MSRIGRKPVTVPNGVTVTVGGDNVITVKGPKGELKQVVDREIKVEVKDGQVEFARPILDLTLGYSHNIIFEVPKELKIATAQEKGQNPTILLEGIDHQLIGQVAAKIRGLRKPEPYKGKGIRYVGEVVRKKAGKAAGK